LSSGFLRQHKQQKQKNLVHVPGVALGLSSSDCIDSKSFFLQQLEQQHVSLIREQQGLQHLKQFMRLQQLGFLSPIAEDLCIEACFCFNKKTIRSVLRWNSRAAFDVGRE
jgi:hypothetical protein